MLHFTVHCGNESNTNLKQFSLTNYQTGVLTDFPPLLPFTKLAGFIPVKPANQCCLATIFSSGAAFLGPLDF